VSSVKSLERSRGVHNKSDLVPDSKSFELRAIRHKNAQYWQSVANGGSHSAFGLNAQSIDGIGTVACGPTCSCSLNGLLVELISRD
jgi:hypothetical protein